MDVLMSNQIWLLTTPFGFGSTTESVNLREKLQNKCNI